MNEALGGDCPVELCILAGDGCSAWGYHNRRAQSLCLMVRHEKRHEKLAKDAKQKVWVRFHAGVRVSVCVGGRGDCLQSGRVCGNGREGERALSPTPHSL